MRIFFPIILGILLLATSLEAQVISPRLLSTLNAAAPDEELSVIVTLADKADLRPFIAKRRAIRMMSALERGEHRAGLIRALKTKAKGSQQRLVKMLKDKGVRQIKPLWIINGIALKASTEVIQLLAEMPEVADIRIDSVVPMPVVVPAATGGVEDNLISIKVPDLWALGFAGQGMVVALLDSGVDALHPDLATDLIDGSGWRGGTNSWFNPIAADCLLPGANCTGCDANVDTPCDFLDNQNIAHGTGVAGIMTGADAGGTSIGVAPAAQWIAAKIFKSDETASFSAIHQALQWVLDPDDDPATDDAPDVVNNSWGLPPDPLDPGNRCSTEFLPDIQALKAAGIAVVFSAGNEGPDLATDVSPGNNPESFAVGSVGTFSSPTEISSFSSRGPSSCDGTVYPEVVAPGFQIRSTGLSFGGLAQYQNGLTGTSFAAPHVTGVMTLLLQAFPGVSLADLEDAIKFSAVDPGNLGPDNDYGFGLIDALGAYDWLIQAPNIAVTDPVPPENDRATTFGPVEPSVSSQQTLFISNSGRGELTIGSLVLTGDPAFSLPTDNCSNRVLTAGQNCDLDVEFFSSTVGTFSGNIAVPSNDFDEPTVNVSLTGFAEEAATPTPRLVVTDSVPPPGDRNIPFGLVGIGNSRSESFQVTNDGLGDLALGALDVSALDASFTISVDTCSNQTLAFTESCSIGVDFAPESSGSFNGTLFLSSNDPTAATVQLIMSGEGNGIPPSPTLVSPADGASDLSTTVSFSWLQPPDSDGDAVINALFVSIDPTFDGTVPIPVVFLPGRQEVLLAGAGSGMVLCGYLLGLKRRRFVLAVIFAAGALFFITSCGGSGSGSSAADPNLRSHTLSGLSPQTTYYWKVSANDGRGGSSESTVWSFSTM